MSVFKILSSCKEAIDKGAWKDDHGYKRCDYCGSMNPLELAELIEAGKATMSGSDWKYGWPHKFYVDVENPTPDAEKCISTHSYTDEKGRHEDKTYGTEGPKLHMKFYSEHLKYLDPETFVRVAPIISKACGIDWTMEDGKLKYSAPCHNYQHGWDNLTAEQKKEKLGFNFKD